MRNAAIVHYNTPELTEAAILSLRKHGGEAYKVYVFDNSDSRPFTKEMDGVTVIDNTKGQIIDFDKELEKYPNKSVKQGCASGCVFGSAKHMMSVQWLMDEGIKDGFLLMDSDILIRQSVDFMFMENECCCGHVQTWQKANNPAQIDRLVPMLLWINAPLCRERGAKFFDPTRCFALMGGDYYAKENWYDTGASFLEDIRSHKNGLCGKRIDIRPLMLHYQGGSWRRSDITTQMAWLDANAPLWKPSRDYMLGGCDIKPQDARIYICTHKDFVHRVTNPVYEVVDMRDGGDEYKGQKGTFWSELLAMHRVSCRKRLPKIVGFCGYRKYFVWLNAVPDLAAAVKARGCCVSEAIDLGRTMREQYTGVGNIADLDLATAIIERKHKAFAPAWHKALSSRRLHPFSMFVMSAGDFRKMTRLIMSVVGEFLKMTGGDIEKRVRENPKAYHIPPSTVGYQIRVGGQLCERIVSAYIDWKFPDAEEVGTKVVG